MVVQSQVEMETLTIIIDITPIKHHNDKDGLTPRNVIIRLHPALRMFT